MPTSKKNSIPVHVYGKVSILCDSNMRLRPLIFAGLLSTSAFAKNILDLSAARNMPAWFLCPACAATVYQTIQQLMAAETKAGERNGQLLSDDNAIAALEHHVRI